MMRKLLFTLFMLMLVAPFASPQLVTSQWPTNPLAKQRTLRVGELRRDNCPQELRGLLDKRSSTSQNNKLNLKMVGAQRVDENTTKVLLLDHLHPV